MLAHSHCLQYIQAQSLPYRLYVYVCVYLYFSPVMLSSEITKLPTDVPVRGFPIVWKFSSFKTSSPGRVSIPKSFASVFIFYIFFDLLSKRSGCLWVPGVLRQSPELVLWKLFHVQMIFWLICRGESGLLFLFLHYLGTALGFFSVLNTIVLHDLRLNPWMQNCRQNDIYRGQTLSHMQNLNSALLKGLQHL